MRITLKVPIWLEALHRETKLSYTTLVNKIFSNHIHSDIMYDSVLCAYKLERANLVQTNKIPWYQKRDIAKHRTWYQNYYRKNKVKIRARELARYHRNKELKQSKDN